jgi:hypothetical protein
MTMAVWMMQQLHHGDMIEWRLGIKELLLLILKHQQIAWLCEDVLGELNILLLKKRRTCQ